MTENGNNRPSNGSGTNFLPLTSPFLRKEMGMKLKLTVLTLLVVGLFMALAPASMAALPTLANNVAISAGTVAAGDSIVIGSYSVAYAAPADAMVGFGLLKGTDTTAIATDLTRVSIYEDINKNGAFEAGVDQYIGGATPAEFIAGKNIANAVTVTAARTQYYIVVAAVATSGATYTALDGKLLDCKLDIDNALGAGASVAEAANNQTVAIVATHLSFDTTGTTLLLQAAATAEHINAVAGDSFLKAVDDYGNLDANFVETVNLAAYTYSSGASYAGLTATANAVNMVAPAAGVAMTAGEIDADVAGVAGEMKTLVFAAGGDYILVATSGTKKLEGSITVRDGAYSTVTGIQSTRGIEFYDTNHNGHIDHATLFFDAPIDINGTGIASFTVSGYTITGSPVTKFDAGGNGIRNAGEYGVTLTLTEKAAYDTGVKPQTTYNAATGTLRDKNVPTLVPQVVDAAAVEVDKARPILVSSFTRDTDATPDGMLDSIVLTFSEAVSNGTAQTGLVNVAGDLTAKSFGLRSTLQNNAPTTITLTGAASGTNVVTIVVNETIPNTGVLPVISYINSGGTANTIIDSATSATGATATNAFMNGITDFSTSLLTAINVKDGASPIITDVTTAEADVPPDGKIDKITVTFSENMNTNALYTFGGVTFYSSLATFKSNGEANNTYTTTSGAATNNQIVFVIKEAGTGIYDTEATPIFRYNATTGNLFDANGFELATYTETGGGGRVQEVATFDGAAPVIVTMETGDNKGVGAYAGGAVFDSNSPNGRLDTMVLTFSEEVKSVSMDGGMSAAELDALIAQFTLAAPALTKMTASAGANYDADMVPSIVATTAADSKSVLTIYHNEQSFAAGGLTNGGDTGVTPTVAYVVGGASDLIKDLNNVQLAAVGATASTDKAKPIVVNGLVAAYAATGFSNINTMDRNAITFGSDYNTGDGYIDSFELKFSETVKMAGVDSAAVTGYFTIANTATYSTITLSSFDIDKDGDVNKNGAGVADGSDATAGLAGFTTCYVYGTSSKIKDKWDTGNKPTVKYNGGSDIIDASTAKNALNTFGPLASYDAAKPVAVLAVGAVSSDEIKVTWSEQPYDDNLGDATITDASNAMFGYADGNAAGVSALAATPISLTGNVMTLKTTGTLNLADVESDSIWVKATGMVYDYANSVFTGLAVNECSWNAAGVGYKIIINDIIAPWITDMRTVDADGNGYVDHIRFTFSELIKISSLDGYASTNALTADAAAVWALAGYTGTAKWNLFENTTAGKAAAFAAGEPIFTDSQINTPANYVFYLRLDENGVTKSPSGVGSTAFAPVVTITSPTISDNKPNLLNVNSTETGAKKTGDAVADKAAPVLLAAKTTSTRTLQATMSEPVLLSSVDAADFDWVLCDALTGYDSKIACITQPSPGVLVLEVTQANAWEPSMGGRLLVDNGGVIVDAGIKDMQSTANVTLANNADADVAPVAAVYYKTATTATLASGAYPNAWTAANNKGFLVNYITITPDASTLAAPATLAIADVPNDQGYVMLATFTPSTSLDTKSYQFYRKDGDNYILVADVTSNLYVNTDGKVRVYVPTPANGSFTWAIRASSSAASSGVTMAAKEGEIQFATLIDGAAKIAVDANSGFKTATGGSTDNIAPSNIVVYSAGDNAGAGAGILVSWTAPADHGIVGTRYVGNIGFPLYGVEEYKIYRKPLVGGSLAVVGTAGPLATSFVDTTIPDGATAYQYLIRSTDSNVNNLKGTGYRAAIAKGAIAADFNANNVVDFADFSIFAANYGKTFAATPEKFVTGYDLNADNAINFSDFSIFAAAYGATAKAAKTAVAGMPTSNVAFGLGAEVDESNSTYYVTVNVGKEDALNAFEFFLAYNKDAVEFVDGSVSGLVGLTMANKVEEGIVRVTSGFIGEKFDGTVTMAFRSRGVNSSIDFEILTAMVDGTNGVAAATNLAQFTYKALPTVYSLSPNYPNPFNPTTTIEYSIPTSGNVELAIYNAAGQKVRTLVSEHQSASFFKTVWDGRNDMGESVGSGIYFYRLVSGNFSKIQKMTLIK